MKARNFERVEKVSKMGIKVFKEISVSNMTLRDVSFRKLTTDKCIVVREINYEQNEPISFFSLGSCVQTCWR